MPQKRKDLKIEGANLWYLIGLITSDGCLSKDGRHIDITSKEHEFLSKLKDQYGITNKIGIKYNNLKQKNFHIQIGNKNLYEFLLKMGLTPRKSLTIGQIKIPDRYFFDFLRGLIDGDGCIRSWIHPTNRRQQWSLRIFSGSIKFLSWLSENITALLNVQGKIYQNSRIGSCYVLKYGKMAARMIVTQCYYPWCFSLERKNILAEECISSSVGWDISKTIAQ